MKAQQKTMKLIQSNEVLSLLVPKPTLYLAKESKLAQKLSRLDQAQLLD